MTRVMTTLMNQAVRLGVGHGDVTCKPEIASWSSITVEHAADYNGPLSNPMNAVTIKL
jgi:hypothetical protein